MKIGQTSLVVFVSKLVGSALGFVATVYFARVLGAEVLGIYSVIIALVAWLGLVGRLGVSRAITKRVSEAQDEGAYMTAGVLLVATSMLLLSVVLLFMRAFVEGYVSGFDQYSSASVVWFVMMLLAVYLGFSLVTSTLVGQRSVHIAGPLRPTRVATQSVIQIALVFVGFELVGMLLGYAVGTALVTLLGIAFVSVRPQIPDIRHFRSLLKYAKFSWLGGLKSRAFNDVDILILGALVSQSLVGIYAVAWSLTKFLDLFGVAVSQTMFPEISNVSAQESAESAAGLVEDSLAYGGFVVIPGAIGGAILSDRLLRIYSSEFVEGTAVLWLLLCSILLYTYMKQQLNALNAVDRPDAAFRVNLVFIFSNVVLNVLLIWQFGWIGAAVASATASGIGMAFSYTLLARTLPLRIPFDEIGRQWIAALLMGGLVWSLRSLIETTGIIRHNFAIVCLLVGAGALVYFVVLMAISSRFRATVNRNLPVDPPYPGA
jgi:O-antigen/teichoic acid export membrane protein